MTSLLGFWPLRKFFEYVFNRSFGKFLKNKIDFNLHDFSKDRISFAKLEINTQMINENLKNSPFKIIHISLGKVTINKPSLNLLTQKISVEVNNVSSISSDQCSKIDVIIMPLFRTKKETDKDHHISDVDDQEETKQTSKEIARSEEFNILNNLINKILSNLEVKLGCLTIRVMTREYLPEMIEDIPTLLLRLNSIEYRRTKDLDPNQRPISDMQVILDGKSFEVQEISLHLMKNVRLSPDESKIKDQQLLRLKFPQEYPLINHPSTILLIKPMGIHSKAIDVSFWFKDPSENQLSVSAKINNIESICALDQIKTLLRFASDINSNFQNMPVDTKKTHSEPDLDSDDLDLFGTIIAGRQSEKTLLILTKAKSQQAKSKSPPLETKAKPKKKSILNKDKMMIHFFKKIETKQEFSKLKDDLKQSMMMSQAASSDPETAALNQSIFQSTANLSQRKAPLSLQLDFHLHKLSLILYFKEVGIAYDHFYDSFAQAYHLSHSDIQPNNFYEDKGSLIRVDQKIGYSHYNMECREFSVSIELAYPKIKKSSNPFKKEIFLSRLNLRSSIKYLQLRRYDLSNGQSLQTLKLLGDIQRLNLEQTTYNQYESLNSQSGIFQSALEFHKLDSTTSLEQSRYQIDKSQISSKRGQHSHGQGQLQKSSSTAAQGNDKQSSPSQENFFIFNLSKLNNNKNHFCSQCIVDIRPLVGPKHEGNMFWANISIAAENEKQKSVNGNLSLGSICLSFGIHEVMFLSQSLKDKRFRDAPLQVEQQKAVPASKKPSQKIQLEIEVSSVTVCLFDDPSDVFDLDQCYGDVIQNLSIENLCPTTCYCHLADQLNPNTLLKLVLQSVRVGINENAFQASIDQIEACSKQKGAQLDLIHGIKWTIGKEGTNPALTSLSKSKTNTISQIQKSDEDHISIVSSDNSNLKYSDPAVVIYIKAESIQIEVLAQSMEQYLALVSKLDKSIKFMQLLMDYHKCFNIEHTNNQGKIKPPQNDNFGIKIQINECNFYLYESDQEKLIRLCLHKVQIEVLIMMNKDQDRFKLQFCAQDLMLLDYLTMPSVFPPEFAKKENIPHELELAFTIKSDSLFLNDLQKHAQFVVVYKQQGLRGEQKALKLDIDLAFDLTKKYQSVMSTEVLAELYTDSHYNHEGFEIFTTYDRVMQLKRNPMTVSITLESTGLIFSLKIQHHLISKLLSILENASAFSQKIKRPRIEMPSNTQDEIDMQVCIEEFMIDYFPSLTVKQYDSAYYEDMMVISYDKKGEDESLFKTNVRTLLYIESLGVVFKDKQDGQKTEVKIKNMDLNLLRNNSCHPYLNPALLLDNKDPINIKGKDSYMDYLGFAQIFSMDLLEMSYTQEENAVLGEEEEIDLFFTEYQIQANVIPNSQSHQKHFKTHDSKQLMLTLYVQKIGFYIAKDSFQTIKLLIAIMSQQLKSFQKVLDERSNSKCEVEEEELKTEVDDEDVFKRIIDTFVLLNNLDNPRSEQQCSAQEESRGEKSKGDTVEALPEEPTRDREVKSFMTQHGYFVLNSGVMQTEPRQDQGIQGLNMVEFIVENYIEEHKEGDLNDNRHQWFHFLPKSFEHFLVRTKLFIELQCFEVKLYQGRDFDFAPRKQQSPFKAGLNQGSDSSFLTSMGQSHRISQSIYILQEDYMPQQPEEAKKPKRSSLAFGKQSSLKTSEILEEQQKRQQRRVRKTYRGFYFCGSLSNVVVCYQKLRDPAEEDVTFNRYSFSVQKIVLKETVSRKGALVRELIQMPYSYLYDNQVEVLATHTQFEKHDEIGLSTKMQPFKLMLNQGSLGLLQTFFDIDFQSKKDDVKLNQEQLTLQVAKQISHKPVFVTKLRIHPTQVVLCYTSHKLDIKDLYYGNYIEYLNIFNINDMKLNIKEFNLDQRVELECAIRSFQLYLEDLIDDQKINVVKAIGPLRSFFNLAGAFYGVVKKPYRGYYSDKGFVKGLNEGVWDLCRVVTSESVNLTNKLKDGYVKIKKAAEKRL